MSIEVAEREVEGIIILDLRGRLVLGEATSTFQDTVDKLLDTALHQVIVNLQHVPFIDSTGLGVLVSAHSTLEKQSGGLRLLHVQQRHLELLVLTKLNTVFRIFDDERSAIDSFFPDRKPRTFDILEFVQSQDDHPETFDSSQQEDD